MYATDKLAHLWACWPFSGEFDVVEIINARFYGQILFVRTTVV